MFCYNNSIIKYYKYTFVNYQYVYQYIPQDFHFGLYDLNYDVFGAHIKQATDLCPAFGEAGIKSTVCGPESFTPDHKPIVGEDVRQPGNIYTKLCFKRILLNPFLNLKI